MPLTQKQMNTGAEWINEQIKQGKKVYVHCRGGAGRSSMAVAAYLLKYGSKERSPEDICCHIRQHRKKATIFDKAPALVDYAASLEVQNRPNSSQAFTQLTTDLQEQIDAQKKPKSSKKVVAAIMANYRKRQATVR